MDNTSKKNKYMELMRVINHCAELLPESDIEDQRKVMIQGMKMIGESVDVDRVSIWRNFSHEDGRLRYKVECEWSVPGIMSLDTESLFIYEEILPNWEKIFSRGESVNGPIDTLTKEERLQLEVFGIQSVLAVPIFHKNEFWGYVSFDDYQSQYYFPEEEASILHSWGLLVIGALQRNEMTLKMKNTMKDLEVALEASEAASRAKSVFLANMSHEIRTPLNAIIGITEILLFNDSLDSGVLEALNKIYVSGDMLLGIINDLLDLSKIESEKFEIINNIYDIASLISDTAQLNIIRIGGKSINFELIIDENVPAYFIGDELRIKQILNNILTNAFKYTKEGTVTFSINAERIDYADDDLYNLIFVVSDTGQGMTEEEVKLLFTEYSRFNLDANRKTEGTGLGMSITNNLLRMMGGKISVFSEPGIGSTFTIKIPQQRKYDVIIGKETVENLRKLRVSDSEDIINDSFTREPMPYGSVLIVDDVETNIFVSKGLLKPYKLKIDSVNSGFDAIKKIENGNVYDIIFMDHMMPGMDGMEATRKIREMGYDHAVVALTANAVKGQENLFLENGFNDFISKPIDIRLLNSVLNIFIRDKQTPEVIEAARGANDFFKESDIEVAERSDVDTELLEIFLRDADKSVSVLRDIYNKNRFSNDDDLRTAAIHVHGLKSALRNVGRQSLANTAEKMEALAKKGEHQVFCSEFEAFIYELEELVHDLSSEIKKTIVSETDSNPNFLRESLNIILSACSDFDEKTIDLKVNELKNEIWSAETNRLIKSINEYLLHSDFDEVENIVANFLAQTPDTDNNA